MKDIRQLTNDAASRGHFSMSDSEAILEVLKSFWDGAPLLGLESVQQPRRVLHAVFVVVFSELVARCH